jgi:cobalamin biosynthesis Co2+ chelatase CbiK
MSNIHVTSYNYIYTGPHTYTPVNPFIKNFKFLLTNSKLCKFKYIFHIQFSGCHETKIEHQKEHTILFNIHGSEHRNNILTYIQQDAMLHSLFYLETALRVSGGGVEQFPDKINCVTLHLVGCTG